MKKLFLLIVLVFAFVSCGDDDKKMTQKNVLLFANLGKHAILHQVFVNYRQENVLKIQIAQQNRNVI